MGKVCVLPVGFVFVFVFVFVNLSVRRVGCCEMAGRSRTVECGRKGRRRAVSIGKGQRGVGRKRQKKECGGSVQMVVGGELRGG